MDIDEIRKLCAARSIEWTLHSTTRLLQRGISSDDVCAAIVNGEIIEQYPTDYPYPSSLVFGVSSSGTPLHVVCAIGENKLWIITVYEPNLKEWNPDNKTRRERK